MTQDKAPDSSGVEGDTRSQSQPSADAGTHIPRSPRELRLLALAEAYEPGNYALCDGVDHVYRNVSNCCQTLRDDIRWALGSGVPLDGGYTPEERRVSDYLLSITEGQIGSGLDPIGFLIASHAAINELRKEAEAMLSASPPSPPAVWSGEDSLSQSQPCGEASADAEVFAGLDAEPSAELRKWFRLGKRLHGETHADRATHGKHPFEDGTEVTTSEVARIEGDLAFTGTGTVYRLVGPGDGT